MIQIIIKILNFLGYDYQLVKKKYYSQFENKDFSYGLIKSTASYSPWADDKEFMKAYKIIREHTLVDIYRCYDLWSLVEEVNKINKKAAFLEVGVWRGGTSGLIAKKMELLESGEILFSADTFHGVVKSTKADASYNDGEHNDTSVEIVTELFEKKLNLKNIRILKGIFPEDTQQLVPEGMLFKFCHIDVDVYKSAEDIVNWIWDKMVTGGIIVFDDFGFITCNGITKFVNTWKKRDDAIFIYNINGHAILVKFK